MMIRRVLLRMVLFSWTALGATAQEARFDEADCDARYAAWSELTEHNMVVWKALPEVVGGFEAYDASLRYPPEAVEQGVEGRVFVWLVVDEEGDPHCLRSVSEVHPLLEAEAIRAAHEMRYRPAQADGRRWAQAMSLSARFELP